MSSGSLSLSVKSDTRIDCSYSYSGIASDRKFCLYMKKTGSPSTPPTIFYPPPSGSGTKSFTGLKPSTNYTFYCYDYKNSTTYTELDRKSATTKSTPPPPPPEPKGTLTASTKSHTEITLNYSYSDGKNVSLFRGSTLIKTFGSGSSSGVYNDSGLTPETSYTYYLRNGTLASSTLLAQATAKTFPEPIGNLSLVKANPYSVKLAYSYEHGTNVSLFNGDQLVETFGSGTSRALPQREYLQGCWPLDETSGVRYDSSDKGNDLSDINTVGYDTGVIGNAAKFIKANSERLQTSKDIFTDPQTELSSFNWVHVNQFNHTGSGISTPISLDNFTYSVGAHKGYLLGSYDNGTVAYFRVIIGDGTDIYSINYDILPYDEFNAKYAGKWLHIGFTFKGSQFMKIYINGVCVATKTTDVPEQMTPSTQPTYLGYTSMNAGYLDGLVDEALLWNKALTDSEVEEVFEKEYLLGAEITVENLLSQAEYTFYLRNGTTPESELLGEVTVYTPSPAEGTLSAVAVDSATIDLIYSFTSGDNVSLFRDGSRIKTFGSGDGSGAYRDTGLSPDTQYNYYLRNGFNETDLLLATASAKTLKEARKAVIEQGKILPLSSKITIFDTSLTRIGIIEDYEYLRWNFRYRTIDDFELKINRYKPNTEYLIKNNILSLYVAGYHRAAMIESIELSLTQEGKISEVYTIRGRGLDNLLAERIALHNTASGTGYDSQNTYAETAMRHYVNVNCMDATDTDRNYSFLYLADDLERGGNIKYDARFQTIAEILEEISLISGLGWSVVLDPTNKRLVFQVLEGLDRSFGNGENSTVMFSPKFGNIQLISYRNSSVGSKNVNYTAGQGEAQERTVVKVTKDDETYTGLSRREVLTDARDLDTADKLTQRGQGRLAELGEEIMLEMENLQTGPFKFGEDFDLGDIVTIEYPDIISADVRVLESQIEISADKGIQNKLILGREFPDLINIRKIENKNIAPEIRR